MKLTQISKTKAFGGWHYQYSHQANTTQCTMRFAIYLPPQADEKCKVPVVYWLSGLTCTDENFMQKSGALKMAAELGVAIVAPDTSPRGEGVPDDENADYDFGLGAGFYVNATQPPWQKNYQMYDYVLTELPALVEQHFPLTDKRAIAGHSMGGYGALVLALRNPEKFVSVSAFSPICNPVNAPWGKKAFSNYLGENSEDWLQYDASYLMRNAKQAIPALVHQGSDDNFLAEQLMPAALVNAAESSCYPLHFAQEDGYDHSYYFIASFIEQHLSFHKQHLQLP
ncbi:MAG: S-formylglutathione hydrolase [Colwellia sp.]|nr:S-formylglutathione hydrolase [Colwellia sp.]